jgi:hypothetical protein
MKVEATALPGPKPALDGGALMSAVVVENEVNIEFLRHFFL